MRNRLFVEPRISGNLFPFKLIEPIRGAKDIPDHKLPAELA
jgi:hypothetical protein